MRSMKRIVILISGRGSNMEAIVQQSQQEQWPVEVAAVISNRNDAAGLQFAHSHRIPTHVVENKAYPSREAFDAQLQKIIDQYQPDLVVLAGFMRILTAGFVQHYEGRMMNIHPSLLPSFPGLATHQQALDAGVRIHGVTVHFVTAQLDHGPIVIQAVVPVLNNDTEESLAKRVLEKEHIIYPRAVKLYIEGHLTLDHGKVKVDADFQHLTYLLKE